MADHTTDAADLLVAGALELLERSRSQLARSTDGDIALMCRIVEETADRLAEAAKDPWCSGSLAEALLDWRDRLSSYLLASRALAELDVDRQLAAQLLRRGVDEVIERCARVSFNGTRRPGVGFDDWAPFGGS
jgi:hypothetical protein